MKLKKKNCFFFFFFFLGINVIWETEKRVLHSAIEVRNRKSYIKGSKLGGLTEPYLSFCPFEMGLVHIRRPELVRSSETSGCI